MQAIRGIALNLLMQPPEQPALVEPVAGLVNLGRAGHQIQGATDAGQPIEAGQATGAWGWRAQGILGQAAIQQHGSAQGEAHRQQGAPCGQLARLGEQGQEVAIALGGVGAPSEGSARAGASQVGPQHGKAVPLQELPQAPHPGGLARTAKTMEHQHQALGLAQFSPRPLGLVQGPMGAGFKGLTGSLINLLIKGPIQE
jgi:hypothetical protein